MDKLNSDKDMRLSAYMMMAKGSTLMVKIDVLQRCDKTSEWKQVGDALIVFVARDNKTGKAYKVPELRISKHDDIVTTRICYELGMTIKDWSKDKSLRDMHKKIPDYEESSDYKNYLSKVLSIQKTNPEKVIAMKDTERRT